QRLRHGPCSFVLIFELEDGVNLIDEQSRSLATRPRSVEQGGTHEPLGATLRRWALGLLWSLKPPRLYGVPAMLGTLAKHYAGFGLPHGALPDPDKALAHPDGLAGLCTDLSVPTLMAGYARGLFPFAHVGPQKWWAPRERMICRPDDIHVAKTTGRLLRLEQYDVTFDTAFDAVIRACAESRPGRPHLTWIRPDIIDAYEALHEAGYAHSVEVWDQAGNLAGGLYGVAVGKAFVIESMFARQPDTSKVGLITLSAHLHKWGFSFSDAKRDSGHLRRLGFTLVARREFNALMVEAAREPGSPGPWSVDKSVDVCQWNPRPSPV
ncbi:MAG: leucyl/phenylalanyl-tRNA--protein transferase, partial [Terriglobia bacterium]